MLVLLVCLLFLYGIVFFGIGVLVMLTIETLLACWEYAPSLPRKIIVSAIMYGICFTGSCYLGMALTEAVSTSSNRQLCINSGEKYDEY